MFTHKKVSQLPKRRLHALKYLTMFFLGASIVMLAAQALNISTSLNNAVQYISKIVLTADGTNTSATGIVLYGSNGVASFDGATGNGVTIIPTRDPRSLGENVAGIHINGSPTVTSGLALMNGSFGGINGGFLWNLLGNLYLGTTHGWDLVVAADGNVGIGTGSPNQKLTVNGVSSFMGRVGIGTSTPNATLEVKNMNSSTSNIRMPNAGWLESSGNFAQLYLALDGNVGINTPTPAQKLEVDGHIRLTTGGYIQAGNNANQLYLGNNGRVGIYTNTLDSTARLTVNGGVYANGRIEIQGYTGLDWCGTGIYADPGTIFFDPGQNALCYCDNAGVARTMTGGVCVFP